MAEKKKKNRRKKKFVKWIILGILAVFVVGIMIMNSMAGDSNVQMVTSTTVSSGQITSTSSQTLQMRLANHIPFG